MIHLNIELVAKLARRSIPKFALLAACSPTPVSTPVMQSPAAIVAAPPAVPVVLPEGPFAVELLPGLWLCAYLPPEIPDLGFSKPKGLGPDVERRLFTVTADPANYEVVYLSLLDPSP